VNWGGVTLSNWDIEEDVPLVHFDLSGNDLPVTVSDFTFRDIRMLGTFDNFVLGSAGMTFNNVHFDNITVAGKPANWRTLDLGTDEYATNVYVNGVPAPARLEHVLQGRDEPDVPAVPDAYLAHPAAGRRRGDVRLRLVPRPGPVQLGHPDLSRRNQLDDGRLLLDFGQYQIDQVEVFP
jgi:hypothetical protein